MILAPTLTLSAGSGAAIVRPTFSRDFAGEKSLNNGTGPAITFTRGTNATFFDASGTLRFAPSNAIRNSQAGGSTNGVIGSGGVMPTNWTLGGTLSAHGLTGEVIGTGIEDGLSYADIKVSGTPTGTSTVGINTEQVFQVVASNGQTWTNSAYLRVVGGSTANASVRVYMAGRLAAGTIVAGQTGETTASVTTAALRSQRYSTTLTFSSASVERVSPQVLVYYTSGQAIDLTLRIAAPQLEQNATASTYVATTGTANFDQPRFDHDPATGASRGLLIEEARTNSIRNSQAGGVAAGTLPTNWTATVTLNGVTRTIVGGGTEDGLSYMDIRYSGTPTGSGSVTVAFDAVAQAVASNGQTWAASAFCRLANGSLTNTSGRSLTIVGATNAGATVVGQTASTAISPTSASLRSQRTVVTITFSDATVERVWAGFSFGYTSGQPIDLTLRIAAPQLEQGAFPTSYIPTTTAAATRSADSAVVTPISSFYKQSEGTLFAEARFGTPVGSATQVVAEINDNTTNNRFRFGRRDSGGNPPAGGILLANTSNGSTDVDATGATVIAQNGEAKISAAYSTNDFALFVNNSSQATDATAAPLTAATHLLVGSRQGALAFLNGHIRKIAYYPRRLSNTLLQQLTT